MRDEIEAWARAEGRDPDTFREVETFFKQEPAPKKQRRKIPDKVRRQVERRSGGICEVVMPNGHRCEFLAVHPHHKRRKGQGGADTAENLLHVCLEHHTLIHSSQGCTWALAVGYLIKAGSGPVPASSAVVDVRRVER